MRTALSSPQRLSAEQLASRLASGERLTVLDVRGAEAPGIDAPGVDGISVPADRAMFEAAEIAGRSSNPVVVVCNRGMTAEPVAKALADVGADSQILDGGMRAWLDLLVDREIDLGPAGVEAVQVQRPGRGCLSYVFSSGGQALVVDPTADPSHYERLVADMGAEVTDVVDSHLHADHISVARELAARTGARLRLPQGSIERGIAYDDEVTPMSDGEVIDLGALKVEAVALPGHTTDMMGLLVGERAIVTGDSLFADGIARPDLERGDPEGAAAMARTLHATLHERILARGDDLLVLPGHTHPGLRHEAVAATTGEVRRAVAELAVTDREEFAEAIASGLPPRPANYETVIEVNAGRRAPDPDLEQGGNSCAIAAPAGSSTAAAGGDRGGDR